MIYILLALFAIILCFSEGQPQPKKGKSNGKVIEPSNTNGESNQKPGIKADTSRAISSQL